MFAIIGVLVVLGAVACRSAYVTRGMGAPNCGGKMPDPGWNDTVRLVPRVAVLVTDGHLPYPFGREVTGYEVKDLSATLEKAKQSGARIVSAPYTTSDRITATVEFPGGSLAEVHSRVSPAAHSSN